MFEIIKSNTKINFVSKFGIASIISSILVIISITAIVTKMQYGVDFRGGAEIQIKLGQSASIGEIRKTLEDSGFKSSQVQTIGEPEENEFLIKAMGSEENLNHVAEEIEKTLKSKLSSKNVEIRKVDIVGPKAGAQLRFSGFQAMLWALIAIMIYIGLRFDFKYSPGAIIALFHDVSIILGIYSFTGTEFSLQTVAAILAVIGYSVNDTVIVYDRVREHENKFPELDLKMHINNAVNETLSRTILTSGTTLFVSGAMFAIGGPAIHDFFLAMTLGIVVGTYSSIFIAAPVTLFFDRLKNSKKESSRGTTQQTSV